MVKISELPPAAQLDGEEKLPVVQDGFSRGVRMDAVVDRLRGMLSDAFRGPPGGGNATYQTLSHVRGLAVPDGTNMIWVAELGESFLFDPAIDAAYVAANADTSVLDVNGRGFRRKDPLREALATSGGAGLISFVRDAVGAVTRTIGDYFIDRTSVMDFIPFVERVRIRLGTSVADHTAYFTAAAIAVNAGIATGAGPGGTVYVPDGRYNVTRVGLRDTHFVGESRDATIITAMAGGNPDGSVFVFDAMLDRDGVTTNTYGNGYVNNMKIECYGTNRSGVRTFGGGQFMDNVWVKDALIGFAIGLPIRCVFNGLRAEGCRIKGIYTFSHPGDTATSTVFNACQAVRCYRGWHITQIGYATWNGCVGEISQEINWFIEGDANGVPAVVSLVFNACGHEGTGVPFIFRRCRDVILNSPRVIGADGTTPLITLDDFTGTIISYSTPGPPSGGQPHLNIINHGSGLGSITLISSIVLLADAATQLPLLNLVGSIVEDETICTSARRLMIDNNIMAQRAFFDSANIDGYSGLRAMAMDNTRIFAGRRIGGFIMSSNGPMLDYSAFNPGDISFWKSNDAKVHVHGKEPDGSNFTAEVVLVNYSNPA